MTSVDGLISGMSTTDTINQLMKVEAAPQTALKSKIATSNKVVTAYQSVNTRMSSLATAAKALGNSDTWGAMKATSNSSAAAVSAQPGASAGSLTFRVDKLAATQVMTYDPLVGVASASDAAGSPVMTGGTIDVMLKDGSVKTLTPDNQSLNAVVAAINGESDLSYKAAAVQVGPGKYTLQLTAKASGAAAATEVNDDTTGYPAGVDLLGAVGVTVAGSDAELIVGTTNPYSITSATNTFADVLSGVTVTAAKAQTAPDSVTIDVAADTEGIAAKIQALVDNANVALNEIASQTKIKTTDTSAGVLAGDSAMRKLSQEILAAVSSGAAGLGGNGTTASFNEVGVSVDRYGKLTFKKEKFLEAYAADPEKTAQYFDSYTDVTVNGKGTAGKFEPGFDTAVGLGRKLEALALIASEGVVDPANPGKAKQGTLQALINRRNDTISSLNDQVSEWDVRLELRRSALQKQFAGLEVALGKMQQQSSWLAGQLAGLA